MSESLLATIKALINDGKHAEALDECHRALSSAPPDDQPRVYTLMELVHRGKKDLPAVIGVLSSGLDQFPGNPMLLFHRGRARLDIGEHREALNDLTAALAAEAQANGSFYKDATNLLAAVCHQEVGEPADVLRVCALLPEDASFWAAGKLHTKAKLVAEARQQLDA